MPAESTWHASAMHAWARIITGERVVLCDEMHDALIAHFSPLDTPEATLFYGCLRTIPNPKRLGVKDQYIGWVDAKDLNEFRNDHPYFTKARTA